MKLFRFLDNFCRFETNSNANNEKVNSLVMMALCFFIHIQSFDWKKKRKGNWFSLPMSNNDEPFDLQQKTMALHMIQIVKYSRDTNNKIQQEKKIINKHKCVTCPKWTPYIMSHNGIGKADKTTIFVYCLGIPFLIFQFFNDFNGPFMFCMSSNYFQCLSFGVSSIEQKEKW